MDIKDIIKPEHLIYKKNSVMTDNVMHYCPGCTHGTANRALADVIEELGIQEEIIGVTPVGCSVLLYNYLDIDWVEAAHGRAPAVATGLKRTCPTKYVFTYQGDGDLAAIGTAESLHACNRGENIVILFVNNGIYGMTGGQMAPTTLIGAKTATTPYGRTVENHGYPLRMAELVAQLPGTCFVTRQAAHTPGAVRQLRRAIKKGFQNQAARKGTTFIEIMGTCNSGWKISPTESNTWMVDNMFPFYQLGDLKDE